MQGAGWPVVDDKGAGVLPWEGEGEAGRVEEIAVGMLVEGVNRMDGGSR